MPTHKRGQVENKIQQEFSTLLEDEYQLLSAFSHPMYALLHDWIDKDEERHPLGGNEQGFQDIELGGVAPKNTLFDDLKEAAFVVGAYLPEEEIKQIEWNKHFTVHAVGVLGESLSQNDQGAPRINVNLADTEEIQRFIDRQVSGTLAGDWGSAGPLQTGEGERRRV